MASVNNASIDIYNLSLSNRRRIFQDRFNLGTPTDADGNPSGPRQVTLDVGYGNLKYTIWQGQMLIASSAREGVDIVTRIESMVGIYDLAVSTVSITMPAGTTYKEMFTMLIGQMPTLQYGFVSDFPNSFARATVLSGKPWDILTQYATNLADLFIDNGKIYVMLGTDKLSSGGPEIPLIDSSSGVLETPRREQAYLSVTTLLEAGIKVNSFVKLKSLIEPAFDGEYSVVGIQHSGTISGAVSGDCRSTFFLLKPDFAAPYNQVQSA